MILIEELKEINTTGIENEDLDASLGQRINPNTLPFAINLVNEFPSIIQNIETSYGELYNVGFLVLGIHTPETRILQITDDIERIESEIVQLQGGSIDSINEIVGINIDIDETGNEGDDFHRPFSEEDIKSLRKELVDKKTQELDKLRFKLKKYTGLDSSEYFIELIIIQTRSLNKKILESHPLVIECKKEFGGTFQGYEHTGRINTEEYQNAHNYIFKFTAV